MMQKTKASHTLADQPGTPKSGTTQDTSSSDHEQVYTWRDGTTEPAIRHEFIRSELLKNAQQAARVAQPSYSWTNTQPRGLAADDDTAPCAYPLDQKQRDWTRDVYPDINFQLEKQGRKNPDYASQYWRHRGRLVLDLNNEPMMKFRHLPDTISSRIHGGHIEALMRFDDRTKYKDIRGRMPPKIAVNQRQGTNKPLQGLGAVAAAAARYREKAGCLSWDEHRRNDRMKDFLWGNLPQNLRERNTTRGFRDLTEAEVATLRAEAAGTRLRKRASTQDAKERTEDYVKKQRLRASRLRGELDPVDPDFEVIVGDEDNEQQPSASPNDEPVATEGYAHDPPNLPSDIPASPGQRPHDSRDDVPSTPEEAEALRQALAATVTHAVDTIGIQPIVAGNLSYTEQLEFLQQQVDTWYQEWNDNNNHLQVPHITVPPTLVQLTRWSGGIQNWRSAKFWDTQASTLHHIR